MLTENKKARFLLEFLAAKELLSYLSCVIADAEQITGMRLAIFIDVSIK